MGPNFFMFKVMGVVIPLVSFTIFGIAIASIFSPKFRARLLSRQVKATKYMTDYSKEDMKDIASNMGEVAFDSAGRILKDNMGTLQDLANDVIKMKENILDENEEALKKMARKQAEIGREPIKMTVSAIKEGIMEDEPQMYCKHCGALIDADSKFCKACGKEQ